METENLTQYTRPQLAFSNRLRTVKAHHYTQVISIFKVLSTIGEKLWTTGSQKSSQRPIWEIND